VRVTGSPAQKEVPIMQTTTNDSLRLAPRTSDHYLGFDISTHAGCCIATPTGWPGEVLLAESMPALRRKIWRWWHQVQ
jgi:hypothetical protein